MAGLPERPFDCVRYERPEADEKGKVRLDRRHLYSTDPSFAGRELIAALGATGVAICTASGELVCRHERAYGPGLADTCDPASQLALLAVKAGGWVNSRARFAAPDELRGHMGSLERPDLRAGLRLMRDQCAPTGWEATAAATAAALPATGRAGTASASVAAARIAGGSIAYDEPVGLAEYDRMADIGEVAWMAIRDKDAAAGFRGLARGIFFSNEVVGAFLDEAGAVRVRCVADLIGHEMAARERSLESLAKEPARCGLLILDEFGCVPLNIESARLLL